MKKNKKVVEAPAPVVEPQNTQESEQSYRQRLEIEKLNATVAEYKKAYETLKMKLQTIFNITQL